MSHEVFVVSLDHYELAKKFGREDPALRALIEGEDEESDDEGYRRECAQWMEELLQHIEKLPAKEADMVTLFFLKRSKQEDIARVFGCTQAAVSYRLLRAVQRLKFLVAAPQLSDEEVKTLLAPHFDGLDLAILLTYRDTTSQSETAKRLGITQGRARHRLFKAVGRLEQYSEDDPRLKDVAKLFCMLRDHPNILAEVHLPQWAHQGKVAHDQSMK